MPVIVIKDYTWRQTSEFVILNIPLRGHPKKVDLFVIDNYMKLSFPPFILELFLWANVIEKESKCTITDQKVDLLLRKTNIDLEWPSLEMQNIDNDFKRECRNQALQNAQKLAQDTINIKKEKRQHLQREGVREQIDINTVTLNKIDATRDSHRKEAMRAFDDWRTTSELPFLPSIKGEVQENRKAYKPPLKWFKDDNDKLKSRSMTEEEILGNGVIKAELKDDIKENEKMINNIKIEEIEAENKNGEKIKIDDYNSSEDSELEHDSKSCSSIKEMNKNDLCKLDEGEKKKRPGLEAVKAAIEGSYWKRCNIFEEPTTSMPLPRKMGTINITFSERKFPTPARESSHVEEQEWLQKQAEARRKIGFDAEDLRPEERDPQWLKDKGDDFFKVGNYLAAISAYSYGIKISDKMASLYVNRSAAHYALENYYRCIDDCSKALELMEPRCEGNRESRARCHARRGAALCKLSAPQHGIPELEAALELTPNNETIKRDILAAKQYFDIKD